MAPPSAEATADEVVIALLRRRRPKSYSIHNGVGQTAAATELDPPRPRAKARLRPPAPHPADVAQSQLFEAILLTEIDELEDRVIAVERRRHRRSDRNPEAVGTLPHELKQLRQRINEARQLLDALRQRFSLD